MRNVERSPRFSGIGGHHSHKAGTVEWLTPPGLLANLLCVMRRIYAVDPCAAIEQPWRTAEVMFTRKDNGLLQRWPTGPALLNPPYTTGQIDKWLDRLAVHGDGMAIIFARTETDAFHEHVWSRASALRFLRGRINFHFGERWRDPRTGKQYEIGDEAPGNAGGPTVLCAYGTEQTEVLAACEIDGAFVPLRFPRSVLGALLTGSPSWREALAEFFAGRDGPVELTELYAAFSDHPKARGNKHYYAKLRQMLQRGPYARVAPGLWEARR